MHNDFEATTNTMIEADPYQWSKRGHSNNKNTDISAIDFAGGRGSSDIDLRWHHPKEFKALVSDQRDELAEWQRL